MKRSLLIISALLFGYSAYSQQDPQFTQNMFNRLAVNPAYAGSNDAICATVISRQQWMGFEGRPKTNLLSIESDIQPFKRIVFNGGLGLTVISDEIGPLKSTYAKLAFSYRRRIAQGIVSVGLEAGMFNQSISNEWITVDRRGIGDGSTDPSIPDGGASGTTFDLGAGLYYQTQDLYVGLSSTHLTQPTISQSITKLKLDPSSSTYLFEQVRHYYLMAGYKYALNSGTLGDLELQPSVFIKTDAVSTQLDLNLNVLWNNLAWLGASYRVEDAFAVLTGINFGTVAPKLEGLKLGLAYDFNISELSGYNNGTVEVLLNYCYKIPRPVKIQRYKSVRFL